jgi:formate-dependent nitrite reductase membrane component NrfD
MVQPLAPAMPDHRQAVALTRADVLFLAVELVLIVLMLIGLASSSESHLAAARLLTTGPYAAVFWVGVVAVGILIPLLLQLLELSQRVSHTVAPALLVLVGGITLRWVMVSAGQYSHLIALASP